MPKTDSLDIDILDLIREEAWSEVSEIFKRIHPVDIAEIMDRAPREDINQLFSLVDDDAKPDVLAELEAVAGSEVLDSLTDLEISDIVEEMAPDDAADVLGDLSEERSEHVLVLMEKEESDEVRKLLEYGEETAGGIMTPDVVAMQGDQTVEEALQAIAYLDTKERFFYAYIVDAAGVLLGEADVWELLRERERNRPLKDVVHEKFHSASVDMDQEEVAQLMNKYDLTAVPVVDADGVLVGRVTADDVIDVMEEEASEDLFRLAGSDDAELETRSPLKSCMVRLPWLLMTLLGGSITSLILRSFLSRISDVLILAAFAPIVLAMGGNTGIQSSVLLVRSIALGNLKGRSVFKLLLREIATGAIMGVVCGLIIGVWAHILIAQSPEQAVLPTFYLAGAVSLALFSAMAFAAVFGALVPILLDRVDIDPAVAAGPFITITNDISALLIYFGVTILLLDNFAGAV
jgi:magnesium transporter